MCGLLGISGLCNTLDFVDMLGELEYRGYDSCGIAYFNNGKLEINKVVGNTTLLKKRINSFNSNTIIGHTRWATHGEISITNAHPHRSNRFIIVHNGVIDNYKELIEHYKLKLNSQTDSEVIALLLDNFSQRLDTIESIKMLESILEGSYAILIIDLYDNNKIYFMKNKSPLLLGISNEMSILSSDQIVFDSNFKIFLLNDNSFGYISTSNYKVYNDNTLLISNAEKITKQKKKSSHYMLDEIRYQATMLDEIFKRYQQIELKEVYNLIASASEIIFVGCGSSFYAASILKFYYEKHFNIRTLAVIASEISEFCFINKNLIFILLSQSGETADVCNALELIRKKGYKTICLCNNLASSLVYNCDYTLPLYAGCEIAVASTKAVSAMIYVGRLIINENPKDFIGNDIIFAINKEEKIREIAKEMAKLNSIFYIGKGVDFSLACEGALKLREISYLSSFAFPSGELKHGSIALIDDRTMCIVILSNIKNKAQIKGSIEEIRARGGKALLISNVDDEADIFISTDILGVLCVLQMLAYYIALELNRNIDQPRNLAKSVTVI